MRNVFLHSTFLNKDFLLDIVRKSIKIFTVSLGGIMEGSLSHFFDVSLCSFFYVMWERFFFHNILRFT